MSKCPVCKNNDDSKFEECPVCGFLHKNSDFINRSDVKAWEHDVVIPYRIKFFKELDDYFKQSMFITKDKISDCLIYKGKEISNELFLSVPINLRPVVYLIDHCKQIRISYQKVNSVFSADISSHEIKLDYRNKHIRKTDADPDYEYLCDTFYFITELLFGIHSIQKNANSCKVSANTPNTLDIEASFDTGDRIIYSTVAEADWSLYTDIFTNYLFSCDILASNIISIKCYEKFFNIHIDNMLNSILLDEGYQ